MRWVTCLWFAAVISGCDGGAGQLAIVDGEALNPDGRVLLVNYWAEWCKPCREEIPELNRFAHDTDGVLVVGVNFDQPPPEENLRQAQKMGIEFPVLAAEPPGRWEQPPPQVLPITFVVDGKGRWRATLVGPQTMETLEAAVSQID